MTKKVVHKKAKNVNFSNSLEKENLLHGQRLVFHLCEMDSKKITAEVVFELCINIFVKWQLSNVHLPGVF